MYLKSAAFLAMLRFDPATEKFESFRSSRRAANVRVADKLVVYRYK